MRSVSSHAAPAPTPVCVLGAPGTGSLGRMVTPPCEPVAASPMPEPAAPTLSLPLLPLGWLTAASVRGGRGVGRIARATARREGQRQGEQQEGAGVTHALLASATRAHSFRRPAEIWTLLGSAPQCPLDLRRQGVPGVDAESLERVHHCRVELGPRVRAQLLRGVLARTCPPCRAARARGCRRRPPPPRGGRRAGCPPRRGRPDSPCRRTARGGSGRCAPRCGRAAPGTPRGCATPSAAWVLTTSYSSSVSRSGLSRIESGIAILPRSCSGAAARISSTSGSSSPKLRPSRAARAPTRWVCSHVLSSRYSAACRRRLSASLCASTAPRWLATASEASTASRSRVRARRRWSSSCIESRSSTSSSPIVARRQPAQVVQGDDRRARAGAQRIQAAVAARHRSPGGRGSRPGWRRGRPRDGLLGVDRELDGRRAAFGELGTQPCRRRRRRARPPGSRRPVGQRTGNDRPRVTRGLRRLPC